jgi:hypothetical protein
MPGYTHNDKKILPNRKIAVVIDITSMSQTKLVAY